MLALRYPVFWSAAGWLLVAGVTTGSLLPARVVHVIAANDKVMHVGMYLLLTLWFTGLYRRAYYAWIGVGLIAMGIALDLLQGLTPSRSLDWHDMLANAVGVLVGLVLATTLVGGWCQRVERRLLS